MTTYYTITNNSRIIATNITSDRLGNFLPLRPSELRDVAAASDDHE
jgi:hypothetical protein